MAWPTEADITMEPETEGESRDSQETNMGV